TAVADPGKTSSLTISGDGTAVDITGTGSGLDSSTVNSSAALAFSPISHRMAETLTHTGRVEVVNGKPAGAVSETGGVQDRCGSRTATRSFGCGQCARHNGRREC